MSQRRSGSSSDPTAAFFEDLARREHEPWFARKKGSVRVELADGARTERWLAEFDDGRITVSKRNRAADAIIQCEKSLFDRIVTGNANAMTALLRGEASIEGDFDVAIRFQRLFPSPQGSQGARRIGERGRRA